MMMARLIWGAIMSRFVSLRTFLLLFVLALVFKYALFGPITRRIGDDAPEHDTFDTRWRGYTATDAVNLLTYYGEHGRQLYRRLQLSVDLVFPLIYSSMLAVAIAGGFGAFRWLRPLALLPFVAALFDYGENANVVRMIDRYPNVEGIVNVASFCTRTKCVLLLVCFVLAVISGIMLLLRRS